MPTYGRLWILLTFVYCGGIFYLSSLPDRNLPTPAWLDWPGSDKLTHAVVYGGLAGLVAIGLWRSNGGRLALRTLFVAPIVFAALYGASDEFHQAFVPTRSPDLLDLLADAAGATMIAGAITAGIARFVRAPATPVQGNPTRLSGD